MSRHLQLVPGGEHCPQRPFVLDIDHVHKCFGGNGGGVKVVLEDIEFSVRRGELICILGRSGCGKTTLLNLLAGFMTPDRGVIRLNDKPVHKPGPDRCVVFQQDALFPWLTVRENIAFGLKGKGLDKGATEREVDRFLDLVGLQDYSGYLPREISGGMKQRVALARVLILQPEVLLMDEPFAALDAQTREEMQNLVLELWRQFSYTILFVTHDVTEAVLLADRILLFDRERGRIETDLHIALPRPRVKEDQDYLGFCSEIRGLI